MNAIKFCKFHGFGNDYIVIEKDELSEISDIGEFTRKISHRHTRSRFGRNRNFRKIKRCGSRLFLPNHQSRRQRSGIFRQRNALRGRLSLLQKSLVGRTISNSKQKAESKITSF